MGSSAAAGGAFSWNSELPSGRNPYWIRDEALAGLGLHVGDAVSVDTRAEPRDGDLVVAEVELEDDSLRTARRYFGAAAGAVRLEAVAEGIAPIEVPSEQVMVMGVVVARLRFAADGGAPAEEPLA
ncbi:MAG: S24 family peptidase [Chloroflexi bacterium]|nr:S24 family peptidase [Chloroflexota bacterium]